MMANHNRIRRFDEPAILGMVVVQRDVICEPDLLEEFELNHDVERAYEYADEMMSNYWRDC